jgi:hypothetical protein
MLIFVPRAWKLDIEGRAFPTSTLHGDGAAIGSDDAKHDPEAEPGRAEL